MIRPLEGGMLIFRLYGERYDRFRNMVEQEVMDGRGPLSRRLLVEGEWGNLSARIDEPIMYLVVGAGSIRVVDQQEDAAVNLLLDNEERCRNAVLIWPQTAHCISGVMKDTQVEFLAGWEKINAVLADLTPPMVKVKKTEEKKKPVKRAKKKIRKTTTKEAGTQDKEGAA